MQRLAHGTVPTGWTITAELEQPLEPCLTTGAAGQNGNIVVTAGNSCGTSAARTLAVAAATTLHNLEP